MSNTAIDIRMKDYYEKRANYSLTRRTPVILRIDGRAFHSFTRHFKKPYDKVLHEAMNNTMLALCKEIQGAKLGYTQSDEISILVTDYDTLETDAWFDYRIQKMCSIAASVATLAFNKAISALDDKIDAIAAKQPNTVPVTYPNLVAINATPFGYGYGYGQTSFFN